MRTTGKKWQPIHLLQRLQVVALQAARVPFCRPEASIFILGQVDHAYMYTKLSIRGLFLHEKALWGTLRTFYRASFEDSSLKSCFVLLRS